MFGNSARLLAKSGALLAVTFVWIGLTNPVWSQDASQSATNDRLLACNAITDPTEKLECFAAVVRELEQDTEVPGAVPPSAEPTQMMPEPAASPAPVAAAAAAPIVSSAPESKPQPDADAGEKSSTAIVATNSSSEADVSTVSGEKYFGLKRDLLGVITAADLEALNNLDFISATIVEVWSTIDNRFEIRLDNGQIWRETDGTRVRIPKVRSAVRISRGSLGSYRMKVDNNNRQAGVRRTK